jgi:hypothetical protein
MNSFSTGTDNASAMALQNEMAGGETLLWAGKPLQSVVFHSSDLYVIPFSLLWGGFAIFWEWGVTVYSGSAAHPAPFFFELWGVPFVLLGQYMIWGRFLFAAWKKSRTYYGVTSKRVMVLSMGASRHLFEAYLRDLDSISITTSANGTGSIEFGPAGQSSPSAFFSSRRGGQMPLDIDLNRLAFLDIADVREVYQLIQSQRERLHES